MTGPAQPPAQPGRRRRPRLELTVEDVERRRAGLAPLLSPAPTGLPRVAPLERFTSTEALIAELLGRGVPGPEAATMLAISWHTLRAHIKRAADKIGGDLPSVMLIRVWWRGAPPWVLYETPPAHALARYPIPMPIVRASPAPAGPPIPDFTARTADRRSAAERRRDDQRETHG